MYWLIYLLVVVFALGCFLCGVQFRKQKWGFLIAGYNDLTENQKAQADSQAISKSMSKCAFWTGVYVLSLGLVLYLLLEEIGDSSIIRIVCALLTFLFVLFIFNKVRKNRSYYSINKD
ncbi:DUF3784 domain-containing protein [Enterococcus innesii]|uniref:DUF3784 domain-containing protein n=1 Tax=Enterococcus innesii TaxID=2839759 RepID=UPI002091B38B|nr:DUF3784 domain-containing protein [Enterococcus innesii]MCO5494857.1 DUF3784 domain-containing protein [Enterococcus innesii]